MRAISSRLKLTGSCVASRTNVRCRAISGRSSVTVKKKRSAATEPLMPTHHGRSRLILEKAKILRRGRIRRAGQPHVRIVPI